MSPSVWTIVLAAGAGRRLADKTAGVPKQYWRPPGAQTSLLDETLARFQPLSTPERTITIVDRSHVPYVRSMRDSWRLGDVVYQPADRGTAAGVLLPLLAVLAASPEAIVVITPSDHGVADAGRFRNGIKQAIARVRAGLSDVVVFGVEPTVVSADYGWIQPAGTGSLARNAFQRVVHFVEKPPLHEAFQLFSLGAVSNTMVIVAKAAALLDRYRQHLPFLTDVLLAAGRLQARAREAFLDDWYRDLPPKDFCRDLLTASQHLSVYTWPATIGWSDLGTPDRLEEWLASRNSTHELDVLEPEKAEHVA